MSLKVCHRTLRSAALRRGDDVRRPMRGEIHEHTNESEREAQRDHEANDAAE